MAKDGEGALFVQPLHTVEPLMVWGRHLDQVADAVIEAGISFANTPDEIIFSRLISWWQIISPSACLTPAPRFSLRAKAPLVPEEIIDRHFQQRVRRRRRGLWRRFVTQLIALLVVKTLTPSP